MISAPLSTAGEPLTLREAFKDHFPVGTAINRSHAAGRSVGRRSLEQVGRETALIKAQFNQITAENDMKWQHVHPREGVNGYDFGPADAFVDFGDKHGLQLVGHTLVWHNQTPDWVFAGTIPPPESANPPDKVAPGYFKPVYAGPRATREELLKRMRDHIHEVVGRYKGKVKTWDVVNEALADGPPEDYLRHSLWLQIIGPDFIAKAFQYAHEADPGAILRYNDFGLEDPVKIQKLVKLIKSLQEQKVPIHAIGTQVHLDINSARSGRFDRSLAEMAKLGLPIHVTELDIQGGLAADREEQLAGAYEGVFRAIMKHQESVKMVTFWGVNDAVSWLRNGSPLLFDGNSQPKPAYDAVLRVAKERPAILRDLTPLHDATRVLVNPHKGWYHHFPDNHPNKYQISREVDLLDFPGMDHLYIRLAWAYLEPKEGQFDWAVIDRLIEKWTAHGLGIAFRISCKETSTDRIEQQFATPRWVMEAGAQGGYYRMGKATGPEGPWEPVYDDPVFLEKLDRFLAAFAARYDGKPWLRYVDIGSIGDWGEGHSWASSRKTLSIAVRKLHVDLHLKHFKRAQLVISDDYVHALPDTAERESLNHHILTNGISYRDDSIMVDGYFSNSSDRFTVRSPDFFADAYRLTPTVLELEHYGKVKQLGNWEGRPESAAAKFGKGKTGPDFLRGALELLHATYIGYHGDAHEWLTDNPELTKELLNRCGYWLFPKSIGLPQTLVAGETVPLTLIMENRGVAPPYAPYELRVKLSRGGERVVRPLATGCKSWLPGAPVSLRHQLPLPSDLKPGDYDVAIALFDLTGGKERPVEFALKASLRDPEGYYKLTCVPVKAIICQSESSGAASGAKNSFGEDEGGIGVPSPNLASDAKGLPADPGNAAVLWEIKVGTHQYSIPTLDRGRIYIGANDTSFERPGYKPTRGGALYCVEQATGKMIWQLASPRYFEGIKPPLHFDQWGCGICSGPVVDGNRVYVVGNRGEILCLDRDGQANGNDGPFKDEQAYMGITHAPGNEPRATDGDIIWKYNLLSELDVVPHDVCGSTLLLQGDYVYACTSNGLDDRHAQTPRPLAPSLIVLDKNTGRLVAADAEEIGQRLLHCHWSSPSAGRVNGKPLILFGGGDGVLYAFQPPQASPDSAVQTLKKVWAYDCNPPEYRKRDGKVLPYSNHTRNSPEGPSEIIGIPVFYQGRVYAAIGQSPVHGNGRGCLSCVDAATGAKVWASELIERTLATATIAEGLLYIPDCTGNLHCFDAATGDRYWVHPLGAKTWGASAFVADDKVYVGTEANVFWVLQAGKTLRVLSKTRMQAVPITPIAAPGVLYIPTQNKLTALTAKPAFPEGDSGPHQRP